MGVWVLLLLQGGAFCHTSVTHASACSMPQMQPSSMGTACSQPQQARVPAISLWAAYARWLQYSNSNERPAYPAHGIAGRALCAPVVEVALGASEASPNGGARRVFVTAAQHRNSMPRL
jgi:hypothetical protein